MSLPLTSAEQARYTAIIDKILATADLNTVTRKKIRIGLENALDGKDLSEQKDAIKRLIEARFDAISGDDPVPPPSVSTSKRQANGHAPSSPPASPEGEIKVSIDPPRKKQKREPSLDADAKLAAELQAQENRLATARTTRGGGVVKRKTKKAAPKKKKSEKRVRGSDESEAEDGSGTEAPKRKAGGGFMKPFNLSENLAELCGATQLSRPQVVKKLWEHIKGNDLQDPKDKRQILCDEKMAAVFKQTKVDMFQMNKIIGSHLYPVEEEG
ncbi:probable UAF30 - subunit of RNA polymerase I transcription factor [Cephalotrichum gorgonifer]|uniref:Probable UAF30 - subunit of RNA polymerase I transcription factor n=1 Tax=Cephalotrichum gorgonifer TaxID=2041049 RepID=A0AAE8SQV2_9PEZI|nr:probable UAF30 - subunit of RNA polymerase I transcription factor [Cephalotrichum gorgonifer]